MWSLIKWTFLIAIIGGAVLAITGYKIRGKTVQEHLKPILEEKAVKEGIRDLRAILGEGLKAAGEAVSEDVTDAERKQLDDLVRRELERGKPIEGAAGQSALPAVPQPSAAPAGGPAPMTEKQQAKEQTLKQAVRQMQEQQARQPQQEVPQQARPAAPAP